MAKAGCHKTNFPNILGKIIQRLEPDSLAEKFSNYTFQLGHVTPLPGSSTSRSITDILGTKLIDNKLSDGA